MSETPSKLERRARALLRAYPAEYRHGRAEEIIGTLLEAAPPGRSFPTARETWSLIAGGRHARAARNRRPGAKANLRLALHLGISIYVSAYFCLTYAGGAWGFLGDQSSWRPTTTLALGVAVALAPWLGSRAATTALAVPAATLVAYDELKLSHGTAAIMTLAALLIVIAALAALSGGPKRLPRSWLWLPGAFPVALMTARLLSARPGFGLGLTDLLLLYAVLLLAVVVVCWLATDARPAFALCIAVLIDAVINSLPMLVHAEYADARVQLLLVEFAFVLPILVPSSWLLLRSRKAVARLAGPGSHPG